MILTFWIFNAMLLATARLWLIVATRANTLTTILEIHSGLSLHDHHRLSNAIATWTLLPWMMTELLTSASTRLSWTWRSFIYIV